MSVRLLVHDLNKRYGLVEALRGVSFAVAAGEVFGLLGVNGAGKTTALECLSGLRAPDRGRIEVGGLDPRRDPRGARAKLGVVLPVLSLPEQVTPREALRLFGTWRGDGRAPEALLDRFGLGAEADVRVQALSQGQRQRLNLALAFLGEPEALLLDEPSTALDPQARRDLQGEILRLKAEGRALVLATHLLDEAEQLCDRVAILDRGRIVAEGTPRELAARTDRRQRVRIEADRPLPRDLLAGRAEVHAVEVRGNVVRFGTAAPARVLAALLPELAAQGLEVRALEVRPPTLEESFLRLTRADPEEAGETES